MSWLPTAPWGRNRVQSVTNKNGTNRLITAGIASSHTEKHAKSSVMLFMLYWIHDPQMAAYRNILAVFWSIETILGLNASPVRVLSRL